MSKRGFGLGVVVGKLRPFHLGHQLVVDTALARCDRVVVIVCGDTDTDDVPAAHRAQWVRDAYAGTADSPRVDVRAVDTTGMDPHDSALWARFTIDQLGRAPDACFTSEEYGPRWARLMGAEHVSVDPPRVRVPVSGSAVRANPAAHLHLLPDTVRAYYLGAGREAVARA